MKNIREICKTFGHVTDTQLLQDYLGYCTRILWRLLNVGEGLGEGSALVVIALLQKVSTAYRVKIYRTYLLLLTAFDHAGVASHLARHLLDVPYTVLLSARDTFCVLVMHIPSMRCVRLGLPPALPPGPLPNWSRRPSP